MKMKKALSMLLALLLLTSLTAAAFAESDGAEATDAGLVVPYPACGLTLTMPWACFEHDELGTVDALISEELGYDSGVYLTQLVYCPNEALPSVDDWAPYLTFLCLREDYDRSILDDPEVMDFLTGDELMEMGTVGAYTHYVSVGTDVMPDSYSEQEVDFYFDLLAYTDEIIRTASFYEPEDPYADIAGTGVTFEAAYLDGTPVDSATLFAQNRITMLNIWETGCGPCKGELGELGEMNARFQAQGCGIVGLLWDSGDDGAIDYALQLMSDAGATYPCITCPENFGDLFDLTGFPTSYFIDSEGHILGAPIAGAMVDKYEVVLESLLSGDSGSDTSVQEQPAFLKNAGKLNLSGKAAPAEATPYRIVVLDEEGNAVEGVTVQFCSNIQCMMAKTDAEGVAEFDEGPGDYTVHLLKVPAGYAKDGTEYMADNVPGEMVITLKAA